MSARSRLQYWNRFRHCDGRPRPLRRPARPSAWLRAARCRKLTSIAGKLGRSQSKSGSNCQLAPICQSSTTFRGGCQAATLPHWHSLPSSPRSNHRPPVCGSTTTWAISELPMECSLRPEVGHPCGEQLEGPRLRQWDTYRSDDLDGCGGFGAHRCFLTCCRFDPVRAAFGWSASVVSCGYRRRLQPRRAGRSCRAWFPRTGRSSRAPPSAPPG